MAMESGYAVRTRMNDYVGPPLMATVCWAGPCTVGTSGAHTLGLLSLACMRCGQKPESITYDKRGGG